MESGGFNILAEPKQPKVLIVDDNYFNVVVLEEQVKGIVPNADIDKFFCPLESLKHVK